MVKFERQVFDADMFTTNQKLERGTSNVQRI